MSGWRLPEWRRISGISNTTVMLTDDELAALELRIDEAIAPYVRRAEADAPAGAHRVRILRHYLPEAEPPEPEPPDGKNPDGENPGGEIAEAGR